MQVELRDRVVMVTGGARRVGRAIALAFAEQGAHLVIHHGSSDEAAAETAAAARSLGVDALIVKADLRDPAAIASAFVAVRAHYGRLDVLVNSASNFEQGDFLDVSAESWQSALDINLSAPFYCSQQAARLMRETGTAGCILNIGDTAGVRPWPHRPQHSVSKAGLIMLTEVTARALARYQIRCNCLVFGPIMRSENLPDATWNAVEARLPLKRSGDAEDAARACLFAATNDFITGAVIRVDGGETLGDATLEA